MGSISLDISASAGVEVVEVDRPDRVERSRSGKSDPVDAVAAARAALSGRASGKPKGRNGAVEAMRVLCVAKRSARNQRISGLCQIRHLGFCAPDELRVQLKGLNTSQLIAKTAGLRPGASNDVVMSMTKLALRELGRRAQHLEAEIDRIDVELERLVVATAPQLLDVYGCGVHAAVVAAGRGRRQPRPAQQRSGVGAPVRHRADPRVVGQGHPSPA